MPSAQQPLARATAAWMRESVLAVWLDVYFRELHWFDSFGPELLNDGYQNRSTYIVAQNELGEPIGTLRIVASEAQPLPVERFIDLSPWLDPGKSKIELTRLMVNAGHRKQRSKHYPFGVYLELLRTAIRWSKSHGVHSIVLNVRAKGEPNTILDSLVSLGFQQTKVRIPDEFDASFPDCTAVFLDVQAFLLEAPESPKPEVRYLAATATPVPTWIHIGD